MGIWNKLILHSPPVVIFVSSKKGCLLLADTINKVHMTVPPSSLVTLPHTLPLPPSLPPQSCIAAATAVGLHGDMAQQRRSEILQEFLEEKHSVLVATNVLGRGIDLIRVRQVSRREGSWEGKD